MIIHVSEAPLEEGEIQYDPTTRFTRVLMRDMCYVNHLERKMGRPMSFDEIYGGPVDLRMPNGELENHIIPVIAFPSQLLPLTVRTVGHESHVGQAQSLWDSIEQGLIEGITNETNDAA